MLRYGCDDHHGLRYFLCVFASDFLCCNSISSYEGYKLVSKVAEALTSGNQKRGRRDAKGRAPVDTLQSAPTGDSEQRRLEAAGLRDGAKNQTLVCRSG